eukprot:1158270-Pelagomonas_calceolata.AAC.2
MVTTRATACIIVQQCFEATFLRYGTPHMSSHLHQVQHRQRQCVPVGPQQLLSGCACFSGFVQEVKHLDESGALGSQGLWRNLFIVLRSVRLSLCLPGPKLLQEPITRTVSQWCGMHPRGARGEVALAPLRHAAAPAPPAAAVAAAAAAPPAAAAAASAALAAVLLAAAAAAATALAAVLLAAAAATALAAVFLDVGDSAGAASTAAAPLAAAYSTASAGPPR